MTNLFGVHKAVRFEEHGKRRGTNGTGNCSSTRIECECSNGSSSDVNADMQGGRDGVHRCQERLASAIASSNAAPFFIIAESAFTTAAGLRLCQILRPNTTPVPPPATEPCTTSSAWRIDSIRTPPAIITGTGQTEETR